MHADGQLFQHSNVRASGAQEIFREADRKHAAANLGTYKVIAHPLAGAKVDRGVEVVIW